MVAHFHHSGRYDRAPRLLAKGVPHWTEEHRLGTFTEIADPDRAQRLEKALAREGFVLFNGKRAPEKRGTECGVTWQDANWDARWKNVHRLLDKDHARRQDNPKDVDATEVILERKDGRTLYVTVAHLYSSVEGSNGFLDLPRVADYRTSVGTWAAHVLQVQRQHNPDGTMVVADFNLHLIEEWVRRYLHSQFRGTGLRLAWPADYRGPGTLHRRVIDGTLTDMEVHEGPEVTKDTPGDPSDHDDYAERLRFPASRKC